MKALRSVASVVLSYIFVFGIVLCSDGVLGRLFPKDYVAGKVPAAYLLWTGTAIYAVASVVGAWICARLAPVRPFAHLVAFFVVGEVLGAISTAATWNKWPHWNSIVWMALWPLCLWMGGWAAKTRQPAPPVSAAAV